MTNHETNNTWSGDLIDAYAHIGQPKYGALENVEVFFDRLNIKQGILVLGPGIPDLPSLIRARETLGDRVRYMGIPFGETESERRELGELQISSGISGMRLVPNELEPNRALIDQLGRAGLWLFAINPFESTAATRFLLDWLERHPEGKIASPHFLRPQRLEERVTDVELFKTLLRHPRYHAIFSRQGGTGTSAPYPHPDLQPWVEQIAELVTWERIMWGSEFPIIYQRNEQPEMARDWLLHLGVKLNQQERVNFYANNARRLFFAEAAPPFEKVPLPPWVARQIDQTATVYLFPANQIFIPMQDHATLLNDYLNQTQIMPDLSFADYIAQVLSTYAADVRRQTGNS